MLDLSLFRCDGKSEFGRYSHTYRGSFHRVNFYPADGSSSKLVFNSAAHPTWADDAEKAIRDHDAAMRSNG